MCGIAGLVFDEPEHEDDIRRSVTAMSRAQRFRGPDGLWVWTDHRVGLGVVRLTIVGTSQGGKQPIRSRSSGTLLIFNGEIYNANDVMSAFGSSLADDESDGVALLALLEARGIDRLGDLSAMFALALYDPRREEVLLARDAWGQKPLYTYRFEGGWAFASTVAAIHAGTGPLRVRDDAILETLCFKSIGGMGSAFEGIEQLPPGSWMRIRRGGDVQRGRWRPLSGPPTATASAPEIQEALTQSIISRCPDRFRPSIFLSGGLDSSIVATVASTHQGPRPWVLTVGYDVGGWQDESSFAVQLANELQLQHEVLILESADVLDLLRDTAVALEDPNTDPVTLATLALARAAAQETKVALTGDGSDEFWGGYQRFDNPGEDVASYLATNLVFEPHELGLHQFPDSYVEGIDVPARGSMPLLDRILRLEVRNRLRNYHLSRLDKLSMAAGLEARSPFLDQNFSALAESIPASVKRDRGRPKGLLIEAFAVSLPRWLLARRKQAFTSPIQAWLAGSLADVVNDLLGSPTAFVRGFLDPTRLLALIARGVVDDGLAMRVWSLLVLEIWHREFARRMESTA